MGGKPEALFRNAASLYNPQNPRKDANESKPTSSLCRGRDGRRMRKRLDLTGMRYGRLIALRYDYSSCRRGSHWLCRCDCGKETIVSVSHLKSAHTISCGCFHHDEVVKRKTHHGHARRTLDGKYHHTKVYACWVSLKGRCLNPKKTGYKNYGGRGIKVCERWKDSFEAFLEDMGEPPTPQHSIDRINNDGNYEPGNCRWAIAKEQNNNQRPRDYVPLEFCL